MSTKVGIFNVRTIFLEEEALRVLKGNFPSVSLKLSKRNVCFISHQKKRKRKKQFMKGISLSHFSDCVQKCLSSRFSILLMMEKDFFFFTYQKELLVCVFTPDGAFLFIYNAMAYPDFNCVVQGHFSGRSFFSVLETHSASELLNSH